MGQELFDIDSDYKKYVDGKMRMDGIDGFLRSRNISLPLGQENDDNYNTQYGLSNLKNTLFRQVVNDTGVLLFSDAIECIKKLKHKNIPLAVASSSKNCNFLLEKAGISEMFQVIVEGNYISKHNMESKPQPDIFIEAARLLKVDVANSVVIEDAISGIISAISAGIGTVIAVDRDKSGKLNLSGVSKVVSTIKEVDFFNSEVDINHE
jgi:alpha,alpha-trehalase